MFIKRFVDTIFFIYSLSDLICYPSKSNENENVTKQRLSGDIPDPKVCMEKIL